MGHLNEEKNMSYKTYEEAKCVAPEGAKIFSVWNHHFESLRFEVNPSDRDILLSDNEVWEECDESYESDQQ